MKQMDLLYWFDIYTMIHLQHGMFCIVMSLLYHCDECEWKEHT